MRTRVSWHGGIVALCVASIMGACSPAEPADVSRADEEMLFWAEKVLERDCMRERGFDPPLPMVSRAAQRNPVYRLLTDVGSARTSGYGDDVGSKESRYPDPESDYWRTLNPRQRDDALAALDGAGDPIRWSEPDGSQVGRYLGGCSTRALAQLYGVDERVWVPVNSYMVTLRSMAWAQARSVAAVEAALERWAACMRSRGFAHATPHAARGSFPTVTTSPSPVEVSTAVAEAECAHSSGLATELPAAEQQRWHALLTEPLHKSTAEQWLRARHAALPRAQEAAGRR